MKRDADDARLDAAAALGFVGAFALTVAGLVIPWSLAHLAWYDVLGFACALGAATLWLSLFPALGRMAVLLTVTLGLRIAAGLIPDTTLAPVGATLARTYGVPAVIVGVAILRFLTLPRVVTWLLRATGIAKEG
jgi:hypothetical protein